MVDESWVPDFDVLVAELKAVREDGLAALRHLRPPMLTGAARAAELLGLSETEAFEPAAIEDLVRRAVDRLGGGTDQDVAEYTFGLAPGYRSRPSQDRRRKAAEVYGVTPDSFRKEPERQVIEHLAEAILGVVRDASMRQARVAMEQRHPADSRLAVQWVERFEAYYRIWTQAWALRGDLLAAIESYRDKPSDHKPWDLPGEPTEPGAYDPVDQGNGYARFALFRYAQFSLELHRFVSKHGGLWLLSSPEVEQVVSDAVYEIWWHGPFNEEEDSWLRRQLADSRHEEQEHFVHLLRTVIPGPTLLADWEAMIRRCDCLDTEQGDEVDGQCRCPVHNVMRACQTYCDTIDADWMKIADWYRPGARPPKPRITQGSLYGELVEYKRRQAGEMNGSGR